MSTLNQTNQPVNSGVTTANYTVPAGKYAKVKAYFYQARSFSGQNTTVTITPGNITLNGSTVLSESLFLIGKSETLTGGALSFTGVYGLFEGYIRVIGTGYINNVPALEGMSYSLAPSLILSSTSSSAGDGIYIQGSISVPNMPNQIEMWCKPGDVIAGSAGNFRLEYEEYTATF